MVGRLLWLLFFYFSLNDTLRNLFQSDSSFIKAVWYYVLSGSKHLSDFCRKCHYFVLWQFMDMYKKGKIACLMEEDTVQNGGPDMEKTIRVIIIRVITIILESSSSSSLHLYLHWPWKTLYIWELERLEMLWWNTWWLQSSKDSWC